MRILLVADTYAPSVNGVAIFTARLAEALGRRGHDVHVLVPRWPGEPSSQPMGTHTVLRVTSLPTVVHPSSRACLWYGTAAATALLRRVQPDVVHLQSHFLLGSAVAKAAGGLSIPVLGTFHIRPDNILLQLPLPRPIRRVLTQLYWAHLRSVYRSYALVTVPAASAKAVLAHMGVAVPIRVISNGVDVAQFRPAANEPQDEEVRRKYALPQTKLALYVGRLDRDKGIDLLGRVVQRVVAGTDAHFVLCGAGPEQERLRRLLRQRQLDERVTFAGWVPSTDMPSVYHLARLLVMTGRSETQPIAALEAMASGLPVIALATPGLVDVVVNGVTGVLEPSGEADALAAHVCRVWEDTAFQASLAGNARQYAVTAHSLHRTVSQFVECYTRLRRPGRGMPD